MKKVTRTAKSRPASSAKKKPAKSVAVEIDPRFQPIVDAYRRDRTVTAGRMMASFGLKVNGRIFAMLVKGKFVAKLPKDRVDALVRSGAGQYFDPGHGRLMKEWVEIAGDASSWLALAGEAHRFVKGS